MPIHDFMWRSPAPRTAAVASSLSVLDTVDSTNTMMTGRIAGMHEGDAVHRVAHLFDTVGNDTVGNDTVGTDTDGNAATPATPTDLPVAVAVSDTQTKCHGRLGRSWYNRPGESLLVSFAVPAPTAMVTDALGGWITMSAGLAVIDAIDDARAEYGMAALAADRGRLTLKWPNDVFCDDRKLAGILSEFVPVDGDWSALVIGVGLNLFVPEADLPTEQATSLQLHYAGLPDYATLRDALMAATVRHLRARLADLYADPEHGPDRVLADVTPVSWTLGREVRANLADGGTLDGTALSINRDASLTIRTPDGVEHVVTTGDVGVMPRG